MSLQNKYILWIHFTICHQVLWSHSTYFIASCRFYDFQIAPCIYNYCITLCAVHCPHFAYMWFIWKAEWQREKRDKESTSICCFTLQRITAVREGPGGSQKAGTASRSPTGFRNPSMWVIICCLLSCLRENLGRKQNSWDVMWLSSIMVSSFTCYNTMSVSYPHFWQQTSSIRKTNFEYQKGNNQA